jgi:hypothetical protein
MNAIIYPVYFHRNFERRWATRMTGLEPRRSRPEGADTCACRNVVGEGVQPAGECAVRAEDALIRELHRGSQSKRRDIHDPAISES